MEPGKKKYILRQWEASLPPSLLPPNIHATLCGDYLEVDRLPLSHIASYDGLGGANGERESQEQTQERVLARARQKIRRLVNTNRLNYLWTLTFAIDHCEGIDTFLIPVGMQRDRDCCLKLWKAFVRRVRRYAMFGSIKYVAVFERHKGDDPRKEGCFHIHFCTNEWAPHSWLQNTWQSGICWVEDFSRPRGIRRDEHGRVRKARSAVRNPGAYMSKYISKAFVSDEDWGKKNYFPSRNLEKPVRLSTRRELDFLLAQKLQNTFYKKSTVKTGTGYEFEIEKKSYRKKGLDALYAREFRYSPLSMQYINELHERTNDLSRDVGELRALFASLANPHSGGTWHKARGVREIQDGLPRIAGIDNCADTRPSLTIGEGAESFS